MNDTTFYHYSNQQFIEKLGKLKDRNVLLLFGDGSAAFGCIGRIDDWVVTLLPAINITDLNFVQLRSTGSSLADDPILTSQLFIDSRDIIHIVEGPFIVPPLRAIATSDHPSINDQIARTEASVPIPGRQYCKLAEELQELAGQNVAIATLGGWTIGGKIVEIDHSLSLINIGDSLLPPLIIPNAVTIFGSVFPLGLRLSMNTVRIWSNLKALTQVILP